MRPSMTALLAAIRFSLCTRAELEIEILALRHQLAVLQHAAPRRLRLSRADRLLWVLPSRVWRRWRNAPADGATWHGRRVASPPVRVAVAMAFDALASRSPSHRSQLRALIQKMHRANRLWGAPHIHGELQKLGIEIAETTVAKYFGRRWRRPHRPGARSCERISPSVPQWTFSPSPRRPSGSCLSSSFSRTTAAASSI